MCVCQSSVRRHCLCRAQRLAQEQSTNAIDNPLFLTLIKMEHVQEIKLSLSHHNEMVSITQLFSSQSDKMIKLELGQPTHVASISYIIL